MAESFDLPKKPSHLGDHFGIKTVPVFELSPEFIEKFKGIRIVLALPEETSQGDGEALHIEEDLSPAEMALRNEAAELASSLGERFKTEQIVPPKPQPTTQGVFEYEKNHMERIIDWPSGSRLDEEMLVDKRSIDQKITDAKKSAQWHQEYERKHPGKRVINRDGTQYDCFNDFTLPNRGKGYESTDDVLATNRHMAYSYLMQRGLMIADDTGLDLNYGDTITTHRGRMFIAKHSDRERVAKLDTTIRGVFPFNYYDFKVRQLEAEKEGTSLAVRDLVGHPNDIRLIIDQLAMTEEFTDLFAVSDAAHKPGRS